MLKEIEPDERDLIGLIARSHTLSLRKCFPYLKENFHIREHNNIHAVYLMVLLRISDYLQIQASRAPSSVTNIKRMKSPFSATEWKIHQSVSNITYANEDPESIFIGTKPKNIDTFLRTQNWLDGIQKELDNSWAILGEIYGIYEKLNKLGLRLRRITSSLDDLNSFRKKVEYIPKKISFDSANPDLLKLLTL